MTTKLIFSRLGSLAIVCLLLTAVTFVILYSTAAPTPAATQAPLRQTSSIPAAVSAVSREPVAVLALPNVGTPKANTTISGANCIPGEKVTVAYKVLIGDVVLDQIPTFDANHLVVDELGSFKIKVKLPPSPGVFPVKVYDEQGTVIAVTLVVVEEPSP